MACGHETDYGGDQLKPEYVQFLSNHPQEITLANLEYLALPGSQIYSDAAQYTLEDGRLMIVPVTVAESISVLGIQPGEKCGIVRRRAKKGKKPQWEVSKAGETQIESQLKRSLELVKNPQPDPKPGNPVAESFGDCQKQHAEKILSGNGTFGKAPLPMPERRTAETAIEGFLVMAGRAARQAEITLGAEGGSVRFDSRDIAALATTCLIQTLKSGKVRLG